MSVSADIAFLESVLRLDEDSLTESEVPGYLTALCEDLEDAGYEIPESFEVLPFIETVLRTIDRDTDLDEGFKDFVKGAAGKVKSVVQGAKKFVKADIDQTKKDAKGAVKAVTSLPAKFNNYQYRRLKTKENAALDAGDEKAHSKYYVAKAKYQDPERFKADQAVAASYKYPQHGSKEAAQHIFKNVAATTAHVNQHKITEPAQRAGHIDTADSDRPKVTTSTYPSGTKTAVARKQPGDAVTGISGKGKETVTKVQPPEAATIIHKPKKEVTGITKSLKPRF
jgi:hypothetical protein